MNDLTTQPAPLSSAASATLSGTARVAYRPGLHRFAIAIVLGTFILIILGGNVTSRGAGLAVPDGFTVYGHYLWSFPYEKWVGNIFHEHIHRLMGSLVGAMCIVAVLLAWAPRWTMKWPYRFNGFSLERFAPNASLDRPFVRWLSLAVLALIIFQGMLGAFRVSEMSLGLAVFHGVHGQIFLCVTVLFAAATSRRWIEASQTPAIDAPRRLSTLRKLSIATLLVIIAQIAIGAEMRHTGAGLAIPDFPSNMGGVVPHFNQAEINAYFHENPTGDDSTPAPTPTQVGFHFAHRIGAIVVSLFICWFIALASLRFSGHGDVTRPALALLALLLAQIGLGVAIILKSRPPDVATAHQALGAATFATAFLLALRVALAERMFPAAHAVEHTNLSRPAAPMLMENAKA